MFIKELKRDGTSCVLTTVIHFSLKVINIHFFSIGKFFWQGPTFFSTFSFVEHLKHLLWPRKESMWELLRGMNLHYILTMNRGNTQAMFNMLLVMTESQHVKMLNNMKDMALTILYSLTLFK